MMTRLLFATTLVCLVAPAFARAAESDYHHVHLMAPDAKAAAAWYVEHMGCEVYEREGACRYGHVQVLFIEREPEGGSVGTAVDHIGFSFDDLDAKMAGRKAAGGIVRLRARVSKWADEQSGAELSWLPIPFRNH